MEIEVRSDERSTWSCPSPPQPEENLIVFEGEVCSITFEGETKRFKMRKPFRYFAFVVTSPSFLEASELVASDRGSASPDAAVSSDDDLYQQGHSGERLDKTAREQYRARLAQLEELIPELEELGRMEEALPLRAEAAALAKVLRDDLKPDGDSKVDGSRVRQDVDLVRQTFNRLMRLFARMFPALCRHLGERLIVDGCWVGYVKRPGDRPWRVIG